MPGARTRSLLVTAIAIVIALAAVPVAGAKKKAPAPKDHVYHVEFTGSGNWVSDENDAVEGIGDCANATDEVNETDNLKWDTEYTITIPAKGMSVEIYKGTDFRAGAPDWTQLSTVTPSGCLGGNEDCAGKLFPASASNPPVQGFNKRPEALVNPEKKEVQIQADSVLGWVVADPTGASACQNYAHYHEALEPFALAKQLHATTRTVQQAMEAQVFVPRGKLDGRSYTTTVKPIEGLQPMRSCQTFTIDAISCVETLNWSGKLEFTPFG